MTSSTLKLTASQAEIILDRLAIGDAITDVLTDCGNSRGVGPRFDVQTGRTVPATWSRAEVDQEQDLMLAEINPDWRVRDTRRPCEIAITRPEYSERRNQLRREIIADTMNGSTWYARSEGYGDATQLELANIERSLEAIARKLEAIGILVDVVTW